MKGHLDWSSAFSMDRLVKLLWKHFMKGHLDWSNAIFHELLNVIISLPLGLGDILFFPRVSVCLSVSHTHIHSVTIKNVQANFTKLHININQH